MHFDAPPKILYKKFSRKITHFLRPMLITTSPALISAFYQDMTVDLPVLALVFNESRPTRGEKGKAKHLKFQGINKKQSDKVNDSQSEHILVENSKREMRPVKLPALKRKGNKDTAKLESASNKITEKRASTTHEDAIITCIRHLLAKASYLNEKAMEDINSMYLVSQYDISEKHSVKNEEWTLVSHRKKPSKADKKTRHPHANKSTVFGHFECFYDWHEEHLDGLTRLFNAIEPCEWDEYVVDIKHWFVETFQDESIYPYITDTIEGKFIKRVFSKPVKKPKRKVHYKPRIRNDRAMAVNAPVFERTIPEKKIQIVQKTIPPHTLGKKF
eukprot:NODE_336_length_9298_cov_0.577889.p3 type:complete len:330 gc:universal NODE_336_length_9298_cov_0.577889:8619-7630(-)